MNEEHAHRLIMYLDDRERQVIDPVLGLADKPGETLSQLGQFIRPLFPAVAHAMLVGRDAIRDLQSIQGRDLGPYVPEEEA